MKVALEFLYHFHCDRCRKWWSRADIEPQIGERVYCPYCGHINEVEAIQTFRNAARGGSCLSQRPDEKISAEPTPLPIKSLGN